MTTVPALRDDDTIREVMGEWLTEQITDSSGLTVAELDRRKGLAARTKPCSYGRTGNKTGTREPLSSWCE
jgi:hypothetical protein